MAVEHRDTVLVPRGYHPCVAPHGYDLYYLNTMAGPQRHWAFRNDPAHEWMLAPRYRLPPAGRWQRWVRHYDDVLLVDTRRGTVIRVIRHFYW